VTLGGVSKMSGHPIEAVTSKIAELAFDAVRLGIPILEIPKYVEQNLKEQAYFSSKAISEALKVQFGNEHIDVKLLM
jgi:hypothetical protein